jgi:predicted peptidase
MTNSRTESSFCLRAGAGLLVAMIAMAGAAAADDQTAVTFKKRISHQVVLDYLLHLPEGYDRATKDQSWPLILFLHGAGERGSDLEMVKKHGPPKLIAAGKDIPAIVVSPQCPTNEWWNDHVEALLALSDDVAKKHRVDPDRVYVTGISMGGFGTWALLAREGERFAAAIPICGGGSRLGLQRAMNVPIWAFHGDADPVVAVDETTRLIEVMKSRGAQNVKLTIYPGVKHDSWTQTYDDPAVWEWLFAQKRGTAKKAIPPPPSPLSPPPTR